MYVVSNAVYQAHQQMTRKPYCRITLIDNNSNTLGQLEGEFQSGSYTIDAQSSQRNTCDLTFIITDSSFYPLEGNKIWIGSKFKLEVGLFSNMTKKIEFVPIGIYLVDTPSLKYSVTTKTLGIKGLDNVCLLDGTRNGYLTANTQIPAGTPLSQAIQTTVQNLGGITNVNILQTSYTVPYLLQKNVGQSVWDILKELRDMFMGFEMYFDENNVFVYQYIKDGTNSANDPVVYDFSEGKNLIIDYQLDLDFQNVKNDITVYGFQNSNGTQYIGHYVNSDTNSPFNVDKIGHIYFSEQSNNIYTQNQADLMAQYEGFRKGDFNAKIIIDCLPVYYLSVNQLIYIYEPEMDIDQEYLISNIQCDLKFDGHMTITAFQVGSAPYTNKIVKQPRVKKDYKPIFKVSKK